MPKISSLKPAVACLGPRVGNVPASETPRLRGRKAVERRARWLRAYPLCERCKQEDVVRPGDEVDDVIPLWKGGRNDESNFQTLCYAHHAEKTAEEARERLASMPGNEAAR